MPPGLGELRVAALQRVQDRHAIQHGQMRDSARVVERGTKRHIAAAVVTNHRKAVVTELVHQLDTVSGLGAFGGACMGRRVRWLRRHTKTP